MDFYAPPSANYNSPDGLTTFSNLMSLKKKKQDIDEQQLRMQGLASENQSLAAKAQGDQQDMQERQAIQQMMKSGKDDQGNSIMSPDPSTGQLGPDPSKVLPILGRIAPKNGQAMAQAIIKTQTDRVGLEAASQSLDAQGRAMLMGTIQAAANDPNSTAASINENIDNLVQAHPEMGNAAKYLKGLAANWDHVPADKRPAAAQTVAAHLQGGQQVQTQATPSSIDNGPTIQPGTTAPAVAGGGFTPTGAPIRKDTAPAIMSAPNGQLMRVPGGGAGLPSTAGGGGSPVAPPTPANKLQPIQRPGMNAPAADQQRYAKIVNDSAQHVQDVSAAANDPQNGVGATRYRNDQILDIVNNEKSPTGPGMASLNWIASKIPGESGDAFQKIGHYLAQNSAAIASKMGVPNTNMGSETAAAASGNTSQNPGAIKEITKVNDALNSGFDLYNRGLAKVSGNGNNPEKVPAFKQAFGQNFDVNVMRYDDALRRNDATEIDKLKSRLGPEGLKTLAIKRKALHSLADTGDMP